MGMNILENPKNKAFVEAEEILLDSIVLDLVSLSKTKISGIILGQLSANSVQKSSKSLSG
ncbi:MAG: hypothetical protein WBP64_20895 [Nitrososphaeraceae archaeon]